VNTRFVKLNDGWNAEPNAPAPAVARSGNDVVLEFRLNPFQFKQFSKGDRGCLVFRNCWRYRLGGTNDEGWYLGQAITQTSDRKIVFPHGSSTGQGYTDCPCKN
jgi:hypothetical protein